MVGQDDHGIIYLKKHKTDQYAILHLQMNASDNQMTYPTTNLTSAIQREALKSGLVKPLLDRSGAAMAFRVVWRNDDTSREHVWKGILSYREACDNILKNMAGVAFFVSSITGMLSRGSKVPGQKTVNPALGYWIVLNSHSVDPRSIVRNMQAAVGGGAEIKLLQEPPLITMVDPMNNTLCNVVKDHANGYVKRRMVESYAQVKDRLTMGIGLPVRMVVLPGEWANVATNAHLELQQGPIAIDLIMAGSINVQN